MATGSSKNRTKVVAYDDYIDAQLKKVRTNLKLTDISGRAMGLMALVVFFLLTVVIVDHWVVDLGVWGRLGSLVALLGGIAFYFVRFLMPEIARKINPAYAAQLVEREEPSLKTSLINFVMLRPKKEKIRKVVFDEVEQQAARRLSEVNVDLSVDQTPLIRIALCLLAALTLFALYTIFSPKSSFQTIGRVLSPFSNVARPARVQIKDVEPGDVQVFAGDRVDVSATIEDAADQGQAFLVYSTADGQVVNQQIEMTTDKIGLSFRATLPEGNVGIEQDITYEIHAGDAVAGPWRVRVSQAPSIFIEEVSLDYPDYTGIETKVVESQGDIEGVEGTKVTITAQANQEIRHARIEFDPATAAEQDGRPDAGRRLTMKHDGSVATVTFPLLLNEDRRTPKHTSYQLRFTSTNGQTNERPIVYPISVTPDLPPLVEVLLPESQRIKVPENAKQRIEIRAVDPDFGISQLKFQAKRESKAIVDESILDKPGLGQRVGRYEFSPQKLGLKAGDIVLYRGEARDNRTDPVNGSPAANIARTDWYAIVVSKPMAEGQEPNEEGMSRDDEGDGDRGEQGDERGDGENGESSDGEKGHDGEGGEGGEGEGEQGSEDGGGGEGDGDEGASGEQDGEGSEGQEGGSQNQSGEGQSSDGEAGSEGDSAGDGNESGEMGDQPGEGEQNSEGQNGESGESGSSGEQAGDSGGESQDGKAKNGESQGESSNDASGDNANGENGNADGEMNGEGAESTDGEPNGNESNGNSDSGSSGKSGDPSEDADSEPVAGDGTEDSEAFDRILDKMKEENGEQSDGTPKPSSSDNDGEPGDESGTGQSESGVEEMKDGGESGEGERGQSGDSGQSESGESGTGQNDPAQGESGQGEQGDSGQGQEGESEQGDGREGESAEGERAETGDSGEGDESGSDGEGEGESGQGESGKGEQGESGETAEGEMNEGQQGESGDQGSRSGESESESSEGQSQGESGDPGKGQSGKTGEQQQGQPGEQGEQPGGQRGDPSSPAQGAPSDGAGAGEESEQAAGEEKADKANLEYTRKATNLALDHLRDKENRRKMQEELGWTKEQMNQFIRRWHSLRKKAANSGKADAQSKASQSELNEALRSLGLTPGRDRMRKSGSRTDSSNRVRDAGTRSRPPKEYEDQYKAYLRSVGNAPGK